MPRLLTIHRSRYALMFALLSAVLATSILSGCHSDGGSSDQSDTTSNGGRGSANSKYTFAIIPKATSNPVFRIAERGAMQAAEQLGDTSIEYDGSETGNPDEQARTIGDMTRRKVSGIAISVTDSNAVRKPIQDAVAAGIPVMCYDSNASGAPTLTFYSVDDKEVGRQLGELLVMAVGGKQNMKGEVAILSGQPSAPNLQARVSAVKEVLAQYPAITILNTIFCNDNPQLAISQIHSTMAAHPRLRGWIMVGAWPLFRAHALDSIPDAAQTPVVAVDALDTEWPYLETGQVYCLLGQKLFGWGQESVHILHNYVTGRQKKPSPFINSGYDLVFKDLTRDQARLARGDVKVWGLSDYKKQWAQWTRMSPR